MIKKLKMYFTQLGLDVQGNNAYGNLKGYDVSVDVKMLDKLSPVRIHVNMFATKENKFNILRDIQRLGFKHFTINIDSYGILLGFNDPLTVGKLLKRMPNMLDDIFGVFEKYEAKGIGYCPICGEEISEETKKYKINWLLVAIDDNCINGINSTISNENKLFDLVPNNYLKGIGGAVLGALVGVISFIILLYIGYISALSSFISILLGTYLYKKLGGKPNAVMIVIVSVVSIVSMLLALWIVYIKSSGVLASDYGFSSTGIQAFFDMMTVDEFKDEFNTNLAMTFFFSVIGVIFEIYQLAKSIKRQQIIK